MQVKIKRKQMLVKKEIDPIISKEDEMKLAQETEGFISFSLSFYMYA